MIRILTLVLFLFARLVSHCQTLGDPDAIVYDLDIDTAKHLLTAVMNKNRAELWDYVAQKKINSVTLDTRANAVAMGIDVVAIAKLNGAVDIYSTSTFEKLMNLKAAESPLIDLKYMGAKLFAADTQGNILVNDSNESQAGFRKLLTVPGTLTAMEVIPEKKMIVTGDSDGELSLWSADDGKRISQYPLGNHEIVRLKWSGTENKIIVGFSNGRIDLLRLTPGNTQPQKLGQRMNGWPVALDCLNDLVTIGTTNGQLLVVFPIGGYETRLKAMVNAVKVIPDSLPVIVIAVGTHGGGIQLISAANMKPNSK